MACDKKFIVPIVSEGLCRHVWSSLREGIFPNPLGSSVVGMFLVIHQMPFIHSLFKGSESSFVGEKVILVFSQGLFIKSNYGPGLSGSFLDVHLLAGLKVFH